MSSSTFEIIAKKAMGKIRPTHRRALRRIEKRRAELQVELDDLAAEEQDILVKMMTHLKIDTDGPFRGVFLADDGILHAHYCTCAPCQAELNNTTVTVAAQIMIERGLIHPEMATTLLQQAAEVDKRRGDPIVH